MLLIQPYADYLLICQQPGEALNILNQVLCRLSYRKSLSEEARSKWLKVGTLESSMFVCSPLHRVSSDEFRTRSWATQHAIAANLSA